MFVINITDEFTLGLEVLRARGAAVDLKSLVLGLDKEELPLQRSGIHPMQEGQQRCISGLVCQSSGVASARPPRGPGSTLREMCSKLATLRREQFENLEEKRTPPYPRRKDAARRRNQKQCLGQHEVKVPSARTDSHVTGTFSRRRSNSDTPVGYTGRIALIRGQWSCPLKAE